MSERARSGLDITFSLEDGESISGSSIDAILENSILDIINIEEIRINARRIGSNDLTEFGIIYRRSYLLGAIRVNIGGKTDAVIAAREEIDRLILATSRWFWIFNYKGSATAFLASLLLLGVGSLIAAAYTVALVLTPEYIKEHTAVTGLVFALAIFWYAGAISYLRDFFFPSLEFRIGKSGLGADRRDAVRKYVFVTALGGMILSFIGRIVWDRITAFSPQPK